MTESKEVGEEGKTEEVLIAKIIKLSEKARLEVRVYKALCEKIKDFIRRIEDPTLEDPDENDVSILMKQILVSKLDAGEKEMKEIDDIVEATENVNVLQVATTVVLGIAQVLAESINEQKSKEAFYFFNASFIFLQFF